MQEKVDSNSGVEGSNPDRDCHFVRFLEQQKRTILTFKKPTNPIKTTKKTKGLSPVLAKQNRRKPTILTFESNDILNTGYIRFNSSNSMLQTIDPRRHFCCLFKKRDRYSLRKKVISFMSGFIVKSSFIFL